MKKRLQLSLTIGMLLLCITGMAHATLLTFDELSSYSPIPNGYGGLNWANMYVLDKDYHPGSGYANGTVSGNNVAFNAYGEMASTSGSTFDFNSAYLTAAWNNGLSITIAGYLDGVEKYQQTVVVDTTSPTLFVFNYYGVDQVTFYSFGGTNAGLGGEGEHFAMDNLTINHNNANPVPVPPAFILFGSGLAGLAGTKLRRKKQKSA